MTSNEKDELILPPKYYLDNFKFLLDFVEEQYHTLLEKEERDYLITFRSLSPDAQCLYVRIANRKGDFFRVSKLNYAEIDDLDGAKNELVAKGFLSGQYDPDEFTLPSFLNCYVKSEFLKAFQELNIDKKLKKDEVISQVLLQTPITEIADSLCALEPVIIEKKGAIKDTFKLLFFGHEYGDMTQFVIRDIGRVKFEHDEETAFTPFFTDRLEIDDYIRMKNLYQDFKILSIWFEPDFIYSNWFEKHYAAHKTEKAAKIHHKIVYKLGNWLEKEDFTDLALQVYACSESEKTSMRRLKLLQKTNQVEAAIELAKSIIDAPLSPGHWHKANDLLNKIESKSLKQTTLKLKSSEELVLNKNYRWDVEEGVVDYFLDQGWQAIHAENWPWKAIHGLFFWEELFDPQYGGIHNPLQRGSRTQDPAEYYLAREAAISEKITLHQEADSFINKIKFTHQEKYGVMNKYFSWHENMVPVLEPLIRLVGVYQVQKVIVEMFKNYKSNRAGFPDVFAWTEDEYAFVEVKSPTDTLSAQQLFWIDFMNQNGINAKILKIRFK